MSTEKFAKEFTSLLIRYTKTSSPHNDLSNTIIPLSEEQIVFIIHHVLKALKMKSFDDNNNLSKISNGVSTLITPETSTGKIKIVELIEVEDTCSSQDVQSLATDDDSSISDYTSLKAIQKQQENSFNTLQNEKKFISRSNPTICVNVSRSDTFVREEKDTEDQKNSEDHDSFKSSDLVGDSVETDLSHDLFQESLNEIRKSAMDIVAKLNYLEQSFPQSRIVTPKVQQTPLIFGYSNSYRTSTANKTRVSTNIRRSSTVFPKTPTSSKLFVTEKGNGSERRKSTGAIGSNASGFTGKSSESTKVGPSISNLTLSPNNKASPCNKTSPSSSEFRPKFTKNPKYAHVRSTIPKAISQRKKIQ
ncbi:PREDICTED: uncharacterized protein LOC105455534 [Wasmannia auropunctata]|uniref:uncharacterized protein LOC105455534 n=1 Tax=Wasmannia auropunctata TaxID=64793 RepID=UPI0005EDA0E9|nr:PREDICTED: uncharacterized protein LOC105455534 [Wasmannia auropunctata]